MDTPAVDLTKYIETRFFGERPHVRGRRLTIGQIAHTVHRQQWSHTEAAQEFALTEAQILAALLYYEEHKAEIDAQEAQVRVELDELYEKYGKG